MLRLLVALVPCLLGAHGAGDAPAAGDVVQPKLVIPGEWMVDKNEQFMFLPLTVPDNMPLDQIKIMSNGQQILVVVTERPQDQPETNAIKKYKLVIEAIKKEAANDEKLLKDKLQTWFDTEEDDEVRVQVRSALDSLNQVRAAKANTVARTVSVPLGMLAKQAASAYAGRNVSVQEESSAPQTPSGASPSFLARASVHNASAVVEPPEVVQAEHALPSLTRKKKLHVGIIKESFAVEIPYPVATEQVFILKTNTKTMMVSMPLKRNSLEAKGISTGGKPFLRVPVFSVTGQKLAGPDATLSSLAGGLHVPSVASNKGLKPLP